MLVRITCSVRIVVMCVCKSVCVWHMYVITYVSYSCACVYYVCSHAHTCTYHKRKKLSDKNFRGSLDFIQMLGKLCGLCLIRMESDK